MSDTIPSDTPAPAVAEPVSAAPVESVAPASTPAIESVAPGETPSPAPVEQAPVEAAPVEAEAAAAEPEAKLHTDTPTLLEEIGGETAPEAPVEAAPAYEFQFPEHFEAEPAQMQAYTGILQEHGISPEIGQKLLDLHVAQVQRQAADTLTRQHEAFASVRKDWQAQIKGDPELGGAAFETVSKAVARGREALVPEGDRKAFDEMLRATGVGDHPAFWRMLLRASRHLEEPAPPPPNARPATNANPKPKQGFAALFGD